MVKLYFYRGFKISEESHGVYETLCFSQGNESNRHSERSEETL